MGWGFVSINIKVCLFAFFSQEAFEKIFPSWIEVDKV